MAKRIEKLTKKQTEMMEPWAEKWIEIGLCTEEADWETWERGAKACYGFAGIEWHNKVFRVGDPMTGAFVASEVFNQKNPHTFIKDVEALVVAGDYAAVRGLVDMKRVKASWNSYFGGTWWVAWSAYSSFFRDVCKLELPGDIWDRDRAYEAAQTSAGWWWPFDTHVVVCDRPSVLEVERGRQGQQSRLHCVDGPAIAYRNGWRLYFIEGIEVPRYVVEQPNLITIEEIRQESNAEKRRVVMQQYGLLRYFKALNATALDSRFGEALFSDPHDGQRWLVCTDGSTGRIYQLPVPRGVETVAQAQMALNGVDPSLMLARS